eukprot:PhF_6_TR11760/c0_g1_i2/m.19268
MILLFSIFFLFTEITSSFPNAPEVYPNGRPNVSVIRPFTDTTQIAHFTEARRWAVIPFLKPLGLKENTFIIPPINGLTARRLMLWGIRARIQVQYSNGSNVANPNINPSCVYLGVDEDKATIPINTSLWYFNSYDMERPSHILFRCQIVDDNIPDHFFDWVMNVSVFVNVEHEECFNITGYNISWNAEYRRSQFSYLTGMYLTQSNTSTPYGGAAYYNTPVTSETYAWMGSYAEMMEYISPANYAEKDFFDYFITSGWLCARGLGNGTWVWECGPMAGKALDFGVWAPGEPSVSDGCLLLCQHCLPNGSSAWYSRTCEENHTSVLFRQLRWSTPYGYLELAMKEELPMWILQQNYSIVYNASFVLISACFRCHGNCARQRVFPVKSYGAIVSTSLGLVLIQSYESEMFGYPNTASQVNVTLRDDFVSVRQAPLRVSIDFTRVSTFTCRITGLMNVTLQKRQPPSSKRTSAAWLSDVEPMTSVTGIIAFLVPSPSYQILPSALRSPCANSRLFNDTALSQSPFQYILSKDIASLHGHVTSRSVSAVLWNIVLLLSAVGLHGTIFIMFWLVDNALFQHRQKDRTARDAMGLMAQLKFPGLLMWIGIFLLQGTTFHVVLFYTREDDENLILDNPKDSNAIMIFGILLFPVCVVGLAFYMIVFRELGVAADFRAMNDDEEKVPTWYNRFIKPQGVWSSLISSSYGVLFESYLPRGRWTMLLNMVSNVVTGALAGVHTRDKCDLIGTLLIVPVVVVGLYHAMVRPHRCLSQSILHVIASMTSVVSI